MKNLLTFLLVHLVDHPDDIVIEEREADYTTEYLITVHPEDVGKVIGKNGRIIQAIRTLSKVRAMKEQRKIMVTLTNE